MKRTNATPARGPRVKLLPACLALALAVGSSAMSFQSANAMSVSVAPSIGPQGFVASTPAVKLSDAQRRALVDFAKTRMRTPPPVPATSIPVTNCNDAGAGSYRQAMLDAVSGDTIDLTNTGCSLITLTTGDIIIDVADLTVQGPGILGLEISGGDHYRPLENIGTGTLTVSDLSISHGKKYLSSSDLGAAGGACIHSAGTLSLDRTWVKYCDAGSASTSAGVKGGAIYAATGVDMVNSIVSSSSAHSTGSYAYGGGVYTPGYFTMINSSISGNTVASTVTNSNGGGAQVGSAHHTFGGSTIVKYSTIDSNSAGTFGGGVYTTGDVTVAYSTISGNSAFVIGGAALLGDNVTVPWSIINSTISGNTASSANGGIYAKGNAAAIKNSTIAFNAAHTANKYGAGLNVASANAVDLESTIIASNTTDEGSGPLPDDLGGVSGASLTGASNLVYFPSSLTTPGGTILLEDPQLLTLSANGGPTATHALFPTSPAIDVGNNVGGFSSDQRGTGYPRVFGAGPDIGAFESEVDLSDVIFANGFE